MFVSRVWLVWYKPSKIIFSSMVCKDTFRWPKELQTRTLNDVKRRTTSTSLWAWKAAGPCCPGKPLARTGSQGHHGQALIIDILCQLLSVTGFTPSDTITQSQLKGGGRTWQTAVWGTGRALWNQQNIRLQGPTHGKNLFSGSDWQHKNVLACRSFFPKMFDGREAERLGWLGSEADQAFMSPWYDIRCASHLYGCVMSASFYHQSLPLDTAHSGFLWSHGLHLQSVLLEPRNQTANHQSPLTHTSLDWYAHNAVN